MVSSIGSVDIALEPDTRFCCETNQIVLDQSIIRTIHENIEQSIDGVCWI